MGVNIRQVRPGQFTETLRWLHDQTFGDSAPQVDTSYGWWWIVWDGDEPVGFAGVVPSTLAPNVGYLKRAGIMPMYRGRGLQRRLLRVREAHARRSGYVSVITDTHPLNIHSSNNLIKAGYRLFEPPLRWGFKNGLYWLKKL